MLTPTSGSKRMKARNLHETGSSSLLQLYDQRKSQVGNHYKDIPPKLLLSFTGLYVVSSLKMELFKSRLNSVNACSNSVHNRLSSSLPSKKRKD
jgi:hypothetical protein